jgi:hypothetical protein
MNVQLAHWTFTWKPLSALWFGDVHTSQTELSLPFSV